MDKTDPVCGQSIDPLRARAVVIVSGERYYFCSVEHREKFAADPGHYVAALRPTPDVVVEVVAAAPSGPTVIPPENPVPLVRFEIGGMTGAEDAERVRKAIARVEGVEDVDVDRVTDIATVTGRFKTLSLVESVATAGFEAAPRSTRTRRGVAGPALLGAAAAALIVAALTGGWGYLGGLVAIAALAAASRWLEMRLRGAAQQEIDGLEPLPEVAVKPGELVRTTSPDLVLVDGVVKSGDAVVDETAIGGLAVARRDAGDPVVAGTRVVSGSVVVEVRRAGADRALDRLRVAVIELARTPSSMTRMAARIERWAIPGALGGGAVAFAFQLLLGRGVAAALAAAAAAVIALGPLPAALAVTPALAIAGARAARRGLLFRTAEALERAASAAVLVLDRGAMLAGGRRELDGWAATELDERNLIALAAAVEGANEGPLARALQARADELGVHVPPVEDAARVPGRGVTATVAGRPAAVGSRRLAELEGVEATELDALAGRLGGKASAVYVLLDKKLVGVIGVGMQARPGTRELVASLREIDVHVALLTGDEPAAAAALAAEAGIVEVQAGLPPDAKKRVIADLRSRGPVAVVGDSVDDAPALAAADVGIAVARGASLELAAGGVTVLRGDLDGVHAALALARRTAWTLRLGLGLTVLHAAIWLAAAASAPVGALVPLACATTALVLGAIVLGAERLRRW